MSNKLLCCIICLNPDTESRFNHLTNKQNGISIISMLENVIGIKIDFTQEAYFPQIICDFCTRDVLIANNVKLKFQESQEVLKRMVLEKNDINSEENSSEDNQLVNDDDTYPTNPFSTELDASYDNDNDVAYENDPSYKSDYSAFESEMMTNIKIEEQFPNQSNRTSNEEEDSTDTEKKYFFYKGADGDTSLYCGQCNKALANKKSLVRHITEVHIKKINFRCMQCQKGFFRKQNFENHMNAHEKNNFKCNICLQAYCNVAELVEHKATHVKKEDIEPKIDRNSEQARTCVLCWKIFSRRDNLNRHIKKVHKISPEDLPEIQKKIEMHEAKEDRGNYEELSENEDDINEIVPEVTINELDPEDFQFQNGGGVDEEDNENLIGNETAALLEHVKNSYLESSDIEKEDSIADEEPTDIILEPNEEITPENIEKYREGLRYLKEHTRPRRKEKLVIGTCHVCFATFSRKDNYLKHLKKQHDLLVDPSDPFKYNITKPNTYEYFDTAVSDSQQMPDEIPTNFDLSAVKTEPAEDSNDMQLDVNIKTEPEEIMEQNDLCEVEEPDLKRIKIENEEEDLSSMQETFKHMKYQFESVFDENCSEMLGQKSDNSGSLIKVVPIENLKEQTEKSSPLTCIICNKIFKRKFNLDRHVSEVHLTN